MRHAESSKAEQSRLRQVVGVCSRVDDSNVSVSNFVAVREDGSRRYATEGREINQLVAQVSNFSSGCTKTFDFVHRASSAWSLLLVSILSPAVLRVVRSRRSRSNARCLCEQLP